MRMGRRADRLKADDPFLPALLPSALADFRPCVGVEMDTTLACLPRRDKREDPRRAGHMHTPDNNSHASISPAIARRQLCSAVQCSAVLCCDVAAPASASPVFQRGGPLGRRSCFSRHTASFLAQAPFPSFSLTFCLARWESSPIDRAGECESRLPADELIQQWQAVGEKACQSGPAVPQLAPSSWPCLMRP